MPPHEAPRDSWRWRFRARPGRIIDGDRFLAQLNLGFGAHIEYLIHITGIPAVAPHTTEGMEARTRVIQWFDRHRHDAGMLWPFRIEPFKDQLEPGRYVASVVCSEGHSLSEALGQQGAV